MASTQACARSRAECLGLYPSHSCKHLRVLSVFFLYRVIFACNSSIFRRSFN